MLRIKNERNPEERQRYFTVLGACAQFALVLGIILSRLDLSYLDFFIGMLYGFSMVGNLAYLIVVVRDKKGVNHA